MKNRITSSRDKKLNSKPEAETLINVSPNSTNAYVSSSALSYEDQCALFDKRFGRLDGSTILSHEEYVKHREFLVGSGFFAFLHSQSSD